MSRLARPLLVVGLLAAGAVLRPEVAAAGPTGACPLDVCIHVEEHRPGTPGGPSGGAGGGSGSSAAPPACVWVETSSVSLPDSGAGVLYDLPMDPGPSPSPDSVLLWERYSGTFTGRLAWSTPGAPAAPPRPDPATVAVDMRAGIERDLPDPEVASDPGAAGACAHAFAHRTGVAGRPEAWPGLVTITWTITWESGARNGTLPDVVKTAPVPRPVGEVQAVVTGTH